MKIECPHCKVDNKIEFSENIKCDECRKSFKGYKFKRRFVSASTALLVGVVGGYKVNSAFDEVRYPLEAEYAIVDTCLNGSKNRVSVNWYESKRDICLCALSNTENEVSYSLYKSDRQTFMTALKKHAEACK